MIQLAVNYKAMFIRLLNTLLVISSTATILFLFFKYLYPFAIVIGVSALLQKPVQSIKRRLNVNPLTAVLICLFLIFFILFGVLSLLTIYLLDRFNAIFDQLPVYFQTIIEALKMGVDHFMNHTLAHVDLLFSQVHVNITQALMETLDNIYQLVASLSLNLTNQFIPLVSDLILLIVEVSSTAIIVFILIILLTKDWQTYRVKCTQRIPEKLLNQLANIKTTFIRIGLGYLSAQFIVSGMTTLVLIIGFSLLKITNAFTLALAFGLIDLIPIIGVGLLLWPWLIYALLTGEFSLTIALSLIYIVIVFLRQFLEPRLISKQMGMSALFVISMGYLCFLLFDFIGIILTPVLLISIQTIKESQLDQLIFNYIRLGKLPAKSGDK